MTEIKGKKLICLGLAIVLAAGSSIGCAKKKDEGKKGGVEGGRKRGKRKEGAVGRQCGSKIKKSLRTTDL